MGGTTPIQLGGNRAGSDESAKACHHPEIHRTYWRGNVRRGAPPQCTALLGTSRFASGLILTGDDELKAIAYRHPFLPSCRFRLRLEAAELLPWCGSM